MRGDAGADSNWSWTPNTVSGLTVNLVKLPGRPSAEQHYCYSMLVQMTEVLFDWEGFRDCNRRRYGPETTQAPSVPWK